MIWTEFLKSTCKPKKVQKNPTCKPIKPDHPPDHLPVKPAQPTCPPEPINRRLADGLSVNLFSTDRQRISPKPDPLDPNPPLLLGIKESTIQSFLSYLVMQTSKITTRVTAFLYQGDGVPKMFDALIDKISCKWRVLSQESDIVYVSTWLASTSWN